MKNIQYYYYYKYLVIALYWEEKRKKNCVSSAIVFYLFSLYSISKTAICKVVQQSRINISYFIFVALQNIHSYAVLKLMSNSATFTQCILWLRSRIQCSIEPWHVTLNNKKHTQFSISFNIGTNTHHYFNNLHAKFHSGHACGIKTSGTWIIINIRLFEIFYLASNKVSKMLCIKLNKLITLF